ncbi:MULTISPECIES: TetR/AcrR family transcriptional regulator [Pseudomonas]|uniref:NfxB-like transcriptional regulator of multidrug resistance genes n=2 Tax=Pseudomonas fluorescens TaxID=294 RepID=Q3KCK5_PSEPF|nr:MULTISPECIES: TetR family transcriptional regulator [Pseudomonas]ABA74500.1 NfxB-like transcriptional regulator of multidrug resistance genes [Pseudomonas fluorescens Pf0-1]KIF60381.1 transcriptional regulator [Pseudomonas fluorescens]MBL0796579.1 TetR family transcriptional regulator [Pseudomonas sp. B7]MBP4000859.1 TetR family transcriptional regulator [Pseudomonas koreensis]MBY9026123.1 TetR family transcriptional regulator [Pseudomonas fluorescens]
MNLIFHEEHLLKSLTVAVVNRPRATMKELAQLAGVSKATLHRYCGTRENLVQRLEEHAEATLNLIIRRAGLQHLQALDALRRLIREHLAHRELLAFLMAHYRPDFLDFERGDTRWQFYLEALDGFFLRGQQQGLFRIDITAAIFTELFITLVYGLVDAEQRGRAANADSARTLEQMFLHGALAGSQLREDACLPEKML